MNTNRLPKVLIVVKKANIIRPEGFEPSASASGALRSIP